MPCLQCENGLWRFGETGECQYESKEACEKANADYHAESKLNQKGYDHAKSLIEDDKIDKNSKWSFSSEDGNALLGEDGDDWDNYSKWFLLTNEEANPETKDRYKFPFGKEGKVYRSALTAVRQRAGQFGYDDVFEAAGKLIEIIDNKDKDAQDSIQNQEQDYDYIMSFTQEQMETLHEKGEVLITVKKEGKEMKILFTYDPKNKIEEEYKKLTKSMLDDELDAYVDRLTDSLKKL